MFAKAELAEEAVSRRSQTGHLRWSPTRILPDLQASILCEEVRQEINGNFIIIGILLRMSHNTAIENGEE